MVKLQTIQGLSKKELSILTSEKKIYIWGTGVLGDAVLLSLKKSELKVEGFLDNRKSLIGKEFRTYKIYDSEEIISKNNIFIIIASFAFLKNAEEFCLSNKLERNIDFISYIKIARPFAAINISGDNVEGKNLPKSNYKGFHSGGNMSFELYKKIFKKLNRDLPLLSGLELFSWGEPFFNKELPKIVKYTKEYVPCFISTSLQNISNLEEVIKAEPYELSVNIHGLEEEYENLMKGALWKNLLINLKKLSQYLAKTNSKINVVIKYFKYKSHCKYNFSKFQNYCNDLKLHLKIEKPYLNSYDNYLLKLKGETLSPDANEIFNNISWDFEEILNLSKKDIEKPCLSQRVFPIINWDGSVSLCHTYYNPTIVKSYLDTSWETLLSIRHNQEQCIECQKHALHRLDLEVLKINT